MYIYPGVRFIPIDSSTITVTFGTLAPLTFEQLLPKEFDWLMSQAGQKNSAEKLITPTRVSGAHSLRKALINSGFARAQPPELTTASLGEYETEFAILQAQGYNGRALLKRRQQSSIAFRGLNQVALCLIRTLAASGFRHFIVDDSRPAAATDLWADPLYPRDYDTRAEAVNAMLKGSYPHAAVVSENVAPSVAVLSCEDDYDFLGSALFGSFDVPHLNVLSGGHGVAIGPFVVPEHSPSLCCYDQEKLRKIAYGERAIVHQADVPEASGVLADDPRPSGPQAGGAQVRALGNSATVRSRRLQNSGISLNATTAEMASVLAAQEIVGFVDGLMPVTVGTVLYCDSGHVLPVQQQVPLDHGCLCAVAQASLPTGTSTHPCEKSL